MYPTQISKNQFGEQANAFILGGSNQIDCNFVVQNADAAGKGITGLSGSSLISSVFMHTTQTPATGNPNPAVGLILVNFSQAFASFLAFLESFISPINAATSISAGVTAGQVYVIAALGTSTAANWQAIGLPANIVPAVGVPFIASVTGNGTGTGTVGTPSISGVADIELVGYALNPATGGGYAILQCLGSTSSSVTTPVKTAPANGTNISLRFSLVQPEPPVIL